MHVSALTTKDKIDKSVVNLQSCNFEGSFEFRQSFTHHTNRLLYPTKKSRKSVVRVRKVLQKWIKQFSSKTG